MRRRSSNYPAELRERAERMVAAVRPDYPSDWPAICAVAGARIGVLGRRGRGLIALRRAAEPSQPEIREQAVIAAASAGACQPEAACRLVSAGGSGRVLSDAELAALPARLAPLSRLQRPARVEARQEADVWFEPGLVLEILSAELALSPNYTVGWGQIKEQAGLAMRFPRFTGR